MELPMCYDIIGVDRNDHPYVLYRTDKPFAKYHTHLKKSSDIIKVVTYAENGKVPRNQPKYILQSIARVTVNEVQRDKINELLAVRKDKGKKLECIKRHY